MELCPQCPDKLERKLLRVLERGLATEVWAALAGATDARQLGSNSRRM